MFAKSFENDGTTAIEQFVSTQMCWSCLLTPNSHMFFELLGLRDYQFIGLVTLASIVICLSTKTVFNTLKKRKKCLKKHGKSMGVTKSTQTDPWTVSPSYSSVSTVSCELSPSPSSLSDTLDLLLESQTKFNWHSKFNELALTSLFQQKSNEIFNCNDLLSVILPYLNLYEISQSFISVNKCVWNFMTNSNNSHFIWKNIIKNQFPLIDIKYLSIKKQFINCKDLSLFYKLLVFRPFEIIKNCENKNDSIQHKTYFFGWDQSAERYFVDLCAYSHWKLINIHNTKYLHSNVLTSFSYLQLSIQSAEAETRGLVMQNMVDFGCNIIQDYR